MRVAIAGCGVGGMAAAAALARAGHAVTIFERFETPRPLGAGLLVQPSGLDALTRLGLLREAQASGAKINRLIGRTPGGRLVLDLRYEWGRKGDYGLGLHRGALFAMLHRAALDAGAAIRTGAGVADIADFEDGVLRLESGEITGGHDLVIVSDGANSVLRERICPRVSAKIYPWGAVWGVTPDPGRRWHGPRDLAQVYDGCSVMIGVLPVGRDPASGEDCVSFFWSLRGDREAVWREGGMEAFRAEIASRWPEAAALLDGVDLSALTYSRYRDVRCPSWRRGRVVLIGDAAHGTSPQLGQGANLALGDAVALADAFAHDRPVQVALPAYEAARRPIARYYIWMSWALTPLFQSSSRITAWWRDLLFGALCRAPVIRNLMAWTLVGRGRTPW